MTKSFLLLLMLAFIASGCTISSRLRVSDESLAESTTSAIPRLGVTKPALCNDYPVEYRKSGSASEITMGHVDFWFLASKPNLCANQPAIEEPKKDRPVWRRYWK